MRAIVGFRAAFDFEYHPSGGWRGRKVEMDGWTVTGKLDALHAFEHLDARLCLLGFRRFVSEPLDEAFQFSPSGVDVLGLRHKLRLTLRLRPLVIFVVTR